jgi:UbiA prenyltransferase family
MQHLRALLATARIANVPSVVSNVVYGAVIMNILIGNRYSSTYTTALASCLLYIAGNFLNDWHDVAWDRQHRPERAIPSGLFRRHTYLVAAILLFTTSLGIGFSVNASVGFLLSVLVILVILYTLIHKKNRLGVWVMGSCRAMLGFVGMASMNPNVSDIQDFYSSISNFKEAFFICSMFIFPAVGMLFYIAGISLLAKAESLPLEQQRARLLPRFLVFSPILTHGVLGCYFHQTPESIAHLAFHALVIFGTCTYFAAIWPRPLGQRVSTLLMGIPLIDAIHLSTLFTMQGLTPAASLQPIFYIPIIAFLLAGLLQKIAPAS